MISVHRDGNRPPRQFFSHKFYSQLNPDLLLLTWQNTVTELIKATRQIRDHSSSLHLVLTFPILLYIIFIRNRKLLIKHTNWAMLTDCPGAFSVFIFLAFFIPWQNSTMYHLAPVISIAFIVSVMLLAGKLQKDKLWVARFIYFLSI